MKIIAIKTRVFLKLLQLFRIRRFRKWASWQERKELRSALRVASNVLEQTRAKSESTDSDERQELAKEVD